MVVDDCGVVEDEAWSPRLLPSLLQSSWSCRHVWCYIIILQLSTTICLSSLSCLVSSSSDSTSPCGCMFVHIHLVLFSSLTLLLRAGACLFITPCPFFFAIYNPFLFGRKRCWRAAARRADCRHCSVPAHAHRRRLPSAP